MSHAWKHFCTVTKHRHKVIAHCLKAGLGWQGLFHDLSIRQKIHICKFSSFKRRF